MCDSCPFNYTEEAQYAQSLGCLPTSKDILDIKDNTGNNWACHNNSKKICKGLSKHRDTTAGKLHLQPGSNYDWISWNEKDLEPILK